MIVNSLAVIGLGSIGRRHIQVVKKIRPDIMIILVRSGKGQDWPEQKIVDHVVYSLHELTNFDVDAAIISSPSPLHIEQAIFLANLGINLLIEKPVSHNLEEANRLLDVVTKKDLTILVGYVLRYDPGAIAYKSMLDDGRLGKILNIRVEASSYLPDWRPEQDYKNTVSAKCDGGGVLLELSHEFDYIRWFFGEISSIFAHLHNSNHLEIEVEECADAIMTLVDGTPISVHLDFHQQHPVRRCVVAGSNGTLEWDAIAKNVSWHQAGNRNEVKHYTYDRDDLFNAQFKHFINCIERKKQPRVSLFDGIQALRLVEMAKHANTTGERQLIQ
jgi:predicted dehydrogenase